MSVAESTAYNVYEKYQLGTLPNDVKDQVIILMLRGRHHEEPQNERPVHEGMVAEDIPPRVTLGELRGRIERAKSQIDNGLARPIDEFFEEMDSQYPWLCK